MKQREIFIEALQKEEGEERNAFLNAACGDDVELRKCVEELLAEHQKDDSFFLDAPPPGLGATLDQPITEKPGTQIGPYKLLQQLGEGGMGVVYMAEQKEPVKRRVALKIIKPGMDTRQVIARFEAERQALAMMDHPNIAKVLDAGATESGRPYFVMELVNGISVTKYCDEQHLTPKERLELFVPICQAVQHAHQKGIIHRDLKPSNILVALYDGQPVPKVIDFGVAKATSQTLTEKTMFTQLGQVVGTLEYMSPEQAERNQLDIDTRSDIYSLGVVLYELLTGDTPFDRTRLRSAAFDEMLRIIREEEPPRPSTKLSSSHALPSIAANRHIEPKRLSVLVRGELDWIVMKALEKDRGRRYETASKFAEDVQHYLNDEPVVACPPTRAYRFRKFARRNKVALATGAVVAAALLLGLVGTTWQMLRAAAAEQLANSRYEDAESQRMRADQERARADSEAERARESAARAEEEARIAHTEAEIARAVNEFVNADLLGLSDPYNESNRDLRVSETLDRASRTVEMRFAQQPLVEAAVRFTIGSAYRALGEYDKALRNLRRARRIRQEELGEEHTQTLDVTNTLAVLYLQLARLGEAESLLLETLEVTRRVQGDEHPSTLKSMNNLASVYRHQGRQQEAQSLLEQASEIQRRVLGEEHPDTLTSMSNLAMLYGELGRHDAAVSILRRTLEITRRVNGEEHPDTLKTMNNLALQCGFNGDYAAAEPLFQRALEIMGGVLGEEHPDTLMAMNNLAMLCNEQGSHEEAELLFEKALEIRRRVLGEEHPDTLMSIGNLAHLLQTQNRLGEAEPLLVSSLASTRRVFGEAHPRTLTLMNNLAELYRRQGRNEEAQPLVEETLEVRRRVLGEEHPDTLTSMNSLASLYGAQGRHEEAALLYRETLQGRQRVLGERHSSTLVSMNNLARFYDSVGRFEEAKPLYQKLCEMSERVLGTEHPHTLLFLKNMTCSRLRHRGSQIDQLEQAIPTFADLVRKRQSRSRDPELASAMYRLALCLLASGNREDYQRVAKQMRETFSTSQSTNEANLTAWTCALARQSVDDWLPVLALAQRAHQGAPESQDCAITLGAVLWRAGDSEAAIRQLESSVGGAGSPALPTANRTYAWFILSMAHHQHGNTLQSQQWFDKAQKWTTDAINNDVPLPWNQQWTLRLLHAEAQKLVCGELETPENQPNGEEEPVDRR